MNINAVIPLRLWDDLWINIYWDPLSAIKLTSGPPLYSEVPALVSQCLATKVSAWRECLHLIFITLETHLISYLELDPEIISQHGAPVSGNLKDLEIFRNLVRSLALSISVSRVKLRVACRYPCQLDRIPYTGYWDDSWRLLLAWELEMTRLNLNWTRSWRMTDAEMNYTWWS